MSADMSNVTGEPVRKTESADLTLKETLDHLTTGELRGFAALHGAPRRVVQLALENMPTGTRLWAQEYELIEETKDRSLTLTPAGWRAAELAAARVGRPYADVSMADVLARGWAAVAALPEPKVDIILNARYRPVPTGKDLEGFGLQHEAEQAEEETLVQRRR